MLDFPEQKKLLEPILKHPSNHICADCDTRSPTWASLDFGVFLCSNCSGAHRALGPTITRVKSANLDLWQEEWVACMILGNEQLNAYWEGESSAKLNKPKMGASPQEIRRYVFNKYVKRKYVKNPGEDDPLTMYRNGGSASQEEKVEQNKQEKEKTVPKKQEIPQNPASKTSMPQQIKKDTSKPQVSLLDFDVELQPPPAVTTQPQNQQAPEQFTEYTECGTSFTNETSKDNFIDFNSLLQSHKQVQGQIHHSHSSQAVMQHNQLYQPQLYNQIHQNYGFAHQQPTNLHLNYPSYPHSNYLQHPYPQVVHHSPPSHFPANYNHPAQPFLSSWQH